MRNLFRLKRLSYKLVSKGFYIIFFVVGFLLGFFLKNINLVDYLKNAIVGVLS